MYILDTNVISVLRRSGHSSAIAEWIREKPVEQLYLSVITLGEIERGIVRQESRNSDFARDLRCWIDRTVRLYCDRLLSFGPEESMVWGRLSAEIGDNNVDLQTAATALVHNAVVVTGNERDFKPTGVKIENPF